MDLIERQAAIALANSLKDDLPDDERMADAVMAHNEGIMEYQTKLSLLPSAQQTLYGYNIEHLELIARVLKKENLPPERVVEALINIDRIVAIVKDEFEETLRKAAEQCKI